MSTIKDDSHMPDTQGNSTTALEGSLRDAGNATGMVNDASMGDCDRDCLTKGFHKVGIAGSMTDQREGDEMSHPTQTPGGFLGRAGGWER